MQNNFFFMKMKTINNKINNRINFLNRTNTTENIKVKIENMKNLSENRFFPEKKKNVAYRFF